MKFDKGLYTDCLEVDQPQGTYRHAKNIVDSNVLGVLENEDGFKSLTDILPYSLIGVVPVEDGFVVFTTDNTDSEIGLVERSGAVLTYTQIYNDQELNFSTTAPIKGEYRRDITGGRIIAWIDDVNSPRILNIDDLTGIDNVSDMEIFPNITNPSLITPVINDTGGSLPTGAIIPITQYKNVDGSTTNWFVHDFVFYINDDAKSIAFNLNDGATPETTSNKSISFTLEDTDSQFSTINVGYILSVNNILTVYKVAEVENNPSLAITITGSETVTDISLDEVLTVTATSYSTAKAITQLAGRLYLGNLSSVDLPELQEIAMDIRIDFTRTLVDVVSNTGSHKDVLPPTFMPGEVYAFYLGVEFKKGGWGFYHIPGRVKTGSSETQTLSQYGLTYKKFQIDDTADAVGAYSNMSYWENEGENYPDDPRFVGPVTGDHRSTPVRHHRFPTLGYIVDTYYSGNASVGVTQLPALGINVSNVNIPVEIQSQISRWKIFFAKKTAKDSLYKGDDLLEFGATTGTSIRYSVGGNWRTTLEFKFAGSDSDTESTSITTPDRSHLRGHSLDLLYSDKSTVPTYFNTNYKLKREGLNTGYTSFRGDGCLLTYNRSLNFISDGVEDHSIASVIDFTVTAKTTRSALRKTKSLTGFTYIPEDALSNTFSTQYGNGQFCSTINSVGTDLDGITLIRMDVSATSSTVFRQYNGTSSATVGEETAHIQYFNLLSAVHNAFQSQELVGTRGYYSPDSTSATGVYGGDSFLCYLSYIAKAPTTPTLGFNPPSSSTGIRVWHGYIGYSKFNFNYRYETPGDTSTFYHGKTDVKTLFSPAVSSAPDINKTTLIEGADPANVIGYTEDYNRLNNFTVGVIFHPSVITQTTFPNTIIYSPVQQEESLEFSWRTFPAGNRNVVGQNKGEIVNLQGFKNRELLIHCVDALFRTRTDAKASAEGENIFFKSAELFDLPPEDLVPTPDGYAGTQHKFACILTKMGYFFPDDKRGKVFLYNGGLEEISSNGMRIFFRDFMNLKDDPTGPDDNPFNNIGYTSGYDERNNRFILTKKSSNNQSWSISYNPIKKVWVSYHTYIPDYMFTTQENSLYACSEDLLYLVNGDPTTTTKGRYFTATIYSSFIDALYSSGGKDILFVGTNWITESYPVTMTAGQPSSTLNYSNTFTHLTAWSTDHCSGRIPLLVSDNFDDLYSDRIRNKNRSWYFNNIRDIKIADGFVRGFYDDFTLDTTKLNTNMEWYDQRKFTDKFIICRYEYDNTVNNRLLFSSADIEARTA